MTQIERLIFLIRSLLKESPEYHDYKIPKSVPEQHMLLRALMNVRAPKPMSDHFYRYKMSIYEKNSPKKE